MGSGKSTLGQAIAEGLNIPFFDLDTKIESGENISTNDIFVQHGEKHFRSLEKAYLQSTLKMENGVIACGGGTPCFNDLITWMKFQGVVIYLNAQPDLLFNRLNTIESSRPLLHNLKNKQLSEFIADKLLERSPVYMQAHYVLNTNAPIHLLIEDSVKYFGRFFPSNFKLHS